MLNDEARNAAYYEALRKAIVPNVSVVYDLGAGSGLLSCMAAKLGARKVFAVERKSFCDDVLRQIIKDNHYEDVIHVICDDSKYVMADDFKLDDPQPPDDAHIFVSETLDAYIVGESFLPSLEDWGMRGVVPRTSLVIPHSASIYVHLSESTYLLNASATVSGFNFSALRPFQPSGEVIVGPYDPNIMNPLSTHKRAIEFDFDGIFRGVTNSSQFVYVELPVDIAGGHLTTLVFSFNCSLDAAGGISLDTHNGTKTHWGQMTYLLEWSAEVQLGQTVKLGIFQMPERLLVANAGAGGRLVRFMQHGSVVVEIYASFEGEDFCSTEPEDMRFELGAGLGEFNVWLGHVGQIYTLVYQTRRKQIKTFIMPDAAGGTELVEYAVM